MSLLNLIFCGNRLGTDEYVPRWSEVLLFGFYYFNLIVRKVVWENDH